MSADGKKSDPGTIPSGCAAGKRSGPAHAAAAVLLLILLVAAVLQRPARAAAPARALPWDSRGLRERRRRPRREGGHTTYTCIGMRCYVLKYECILTYECI